MLAAQIDDSYFQKQAFASFAELNGRFARPAWGRVVGFEHYLLGKIVNG